MKGLDFNAGFVAWVGKVADDDALVLQILRKAGCVFHARTTEPQSLVSMKKCHDRIDSSGKSRVGGCCLSF